MSNGMTTKQAAQFIGISPSTLYAWVAEARIPYSRLSARRLRFDRVEIEAWIRERRVPARGSVA